MPVHTVKKEPCWQRRREAGISSHNGIYVGDLKGVSQNKTASFSYFGTSPLLFRIVFLMIICQVFVGDLVLSPLSVHSKDGSYIPIPPTLSTVHPESPHLS